MSNPSIYTVGGTVQASKGIYITREADEDLLKLCRSRNFAYVLSARQVGKSSLMIRTVNQLSAEGVKCITIDLNRIGTRLKAEEWYRSLLENIEHQLNLRTDSSAWWHSHKEISSHAERFALFLEAVVLAEVSAPIVCFIDEIDTTLSLDFTDDFFAVIRHLYNARARAPQLERLSFVLIGVATPSDLIKDPVRTPFNIGEPVQITDFTFQNALPLAAGLGLPEEQSHRVLEKVLQWTGGHPYLTQRLCRAIVDEKISSESDLDVDQTVDDCFLGQNSIKDHNLAFVRRMLTQVTPDPAGVLTTYRKVRKGKLVSDDEQSLIKSHLKLSGIVKSDGGFLRPRNAIYKRVFDDKWVVENMPDAERRRERAAFRRGVLLASLVATVVLSVVTFMALFAERQRARAVAAEYEQRKLAQSEATARTQEQAQRMLADQATAQANSQRDIAEAKRKEALQQRAIAETNARQASFEKGRAEIETQRALEQEKRAEAESTALRQNVVTVQEAIIPYRRALYAAYMDLTQQAYNDGRIGRGQDFLKAQLVDDGLPDPRGFEWYYLWHLFNADRATLSGAKGSVTDAAYSPDGGTIATSSLDGQISLWDARTLELRSIQLEAGAANTIAFSPDGKFLIAGGTDGSVRWWDMTLPTRNLEVLRVSGWDISRMALSSNGSQLAVVNGFGDLALFDVASRKELTQFNEEGIPAFQDVAFSPNGKILVATDQRGVGLFDTATHKRFATLTVTNGTTTAIAFSPDSSIIAACTDEGTVTLWDARSCQGTSCKEIATMKAQSAQINAVAFSRDGQTFATGSEDKSIKVWAVASREELFTFKGHQGAVNSVAYSPDGTSLVTSSADRTAKVWSLQAPSNSSASLALSKEDVSVAISPDLKIAAINKDEELVLWDLENHRVLRRVGLAGLREIAFSPDGKVIAVGTDRGIQLLDTETFKVKQSLPGVDSLSIVFSYDSKILAAQATIGDSLIKVWDTTSGQLIRTFDQIPFSAALALSKDNSVLAAGTQEGGVQLFDIKLGEEIQSIDSSIGRFYALAFSPVSNTIAMGGADGVIKILDLDKDVVRTLEVFDQLVTAVSFSPDGKTLITGTGDGLVKLWDFASGLETLTLKDHEKPIRTALISTDGRTLITASSDKIRLWSGATDEELMKKRFISRLSQ